MNFLYKTYIIELFSLKIKQVPAEVILHFNHNGQDCCAKVSGDSLLDKGDKVTLWIDMAYISAFDLETQENITLRKGIFS